MVKNLLTDCTCCKCCACCPFCSFYAFYLFEYQLLLGTSNGPEDGRPFGADDYHIDREVFENDDGAVLELPLGKSEVVEVELPLGAGDGPNDWEVIVYDDGESTKTATWHI